MSLSKLENLLRREVQKRELFEEGLEIVTLVGSLARQKKELTAGMKKANEDKDKADGVLKVVKGKISGAIQEAEAIVKEAKDIRLKANKDSKAKQEDAEKKAAKTMEDAEVKAETSMKLANEDVKRSEREEAALSETLKALGEEIKVKTAELNNLDKIVADKKAEIEKVLSGL